MAAASPPETTTDPQPSEHVAALEGRIDQLTNAIQAQGDRDGQLAQLVTNLQSQLSNLAPQQPTEPANPSASEEFQRMYADIPGYIREVALAANKEVLGPHLANQANQVRDAMLMQARAGVDGEYGEGTWDEHFERKSVV